VNDGLRGERGGRVVSEIGRGEGRVAQDVGGGEREQGRFAEALAAAIAGVEVIERGLRDAT
jgi:hypothetical protein